MTAYNQTLIKTETLGDGVEIRYFAEAYGTGSPWLMDLYTPTDQHEAGVTIKNPDYSGRGDYKYFIGQYTPAELAADFAAQGRENPSAEAYASLQRELKHYIDADDCGFYADLVCVTDDGGEDVLQTVHGGLCFDYSDAEYCGDFEETAREIGKNNGVFDDMREELLQDVARKAAHLEHSLAVVRGLAPITTTTTTTTTTEH